MLRITVEAIGPEARAEAEHFCICLGHQGQLTDTFLTLVMRVANGEIYVAAHGVLEAGEPELPPRIPGKCRLCEISMPMPGNLGLCDRCLAEILDSQIEARRTGDYRPPPPPLPLDEAEQDAPGEEANSGD